ncbi:MAG: citrate synthase [Roseibium sp.]|nr:citrate synthase [Roseibium sp.]
MTQALNPATVAAQTDTGLEGVVAAHTKLSTVDGAAGELILRGLRIEHMAGQMPFEAAVAHLWQDTVHLETGKDPDALRVAFGAARDSAVSALPAMTAGSPALSPFDRVQIGIAALALDDGLPDAVQITGAMPVLVAAAARIGLGKEPIAPDPALGFADDLLRMVSGAPAPDWAVDALDRYLVTVLDHGLNASTFAARVIASTRADMRDAVLGAMCALKGPLHGGAPGPVLDMLDAAGSPENAAGWIDRELQAGRRIMGFGHRIYRTRDPRADVLKAGVRTLPRSDRLILAEAVEKAALKALRAAKPDRVLDTNVEFYTAILLDGIGVDRALFTPLFAAGRTAGWCAHVIEQQQTGKLIRPASVYIGPDPAPSGT